MYKPEFDHKSSYISETARTLAERADEHVKGLRRLDVKNLVLRHLGILWFGDPLLRMWHEANMIIKSASKSEYKGYMPKQQKKFEVVRQSTGSIENYSGLSSLASDIVF